MGTYRLGWPGVDDLTVFIIDPQQKQVYGPDFPLPDHLCHLNRFENKYVEYNSVLRLFEVRDRTDACKMLNCLEELPGIKKYFTMTYEVFGENRELRLRTASFVPIGTLLLFLLAHPKCTRFFLARSEILCHLDGWLEAPCKLCFFVRRECICRVGEQDESEHIGYVTEVCEASSQTDPLPTPPPPPLPPTPQFMQHMSQSPHMMQPQPMGNSMYPYIAPMMMTPYGMQPMPPNMANSSALMNPGMRCALMLPPGVKGLPPGSRLPLGPIPPHGMRLPGMRPDMYPPAMHPGLPFANSATSSASIPPPRPMSPTPISSETETSTDNNSNTTATSTSTTAASTVVINVRPTSQKVTFDVGVQTPKNLCDAKRKIKLRMWKKSLIPGNENTSPITVLEARTKVDTSSKEDTPDREVNGSAAKKAKLDLSLIDSPGISKQKGDASSTDGSDKPSSDSTPRSPGKIDAPSPVVPNSGGRVYKQLQWRLLESDEDTDEEQDTPMTEGDKLGKDVKDDISDKSAVSDAQGMDGAKPKEKATKMDTDKELVTGEKVTKIDTDKELVTGEKVTKMDTDKELVTGESKKETGKTIMDAADIKENESKEDDAIGEDGLIIDLTHDASSTDNDGEEKMEVLSEVQAAMRATSAAIAEGQKIVGDISIKNRSEETHGTDEVSGTAMELEDASEHDTSQSSEKFEHEDKSKDKDKPEVEDKPDVRDKPEIEDKSEFGGKPEAAVEPEVEDKPVVEDKSEVEDKPEVENKHESEDEIGSGDKPEEKNTLSVLEKSSEIQDSSTSQIIEKNKAAEDAGKVEKPHDTGESSQHDQVHTETPTDRVNRVCDNKLSQMTDKVHGDDGDKETDNLQCGKDADTEKVSDSTDKDSSAVGVEEDSKKKKVPTATLR